MSERTDQIDELLGELPGYVSQVEIHAQDEDWGDAMAELHLLVSDAVKLIALCLEESGGPRTTADYGEWLRDPTAFLYRDARGE
ncbi:hypothetical protein [Spirillospora sp. NPDC047279]|uniref:hypothetical protein n=1 Tax=Spirillospora sp. NPDC047279 TaxID=3155478 RepID=UPI0033C98A90